MKGYHTFEQLKEPGEWFEIELLIQYLSVLYWKKFGNNIGLISEPNHIHILEKYDMANIYDTIDYEYLPTTNDIDRKRFWAMAKILCHNIISDDAYVLFDTDVYLRKMPELDNTKSFIGNHIENHLTVGGKGVYLDFKSIVGDKLYSELKQYEDVMPVNTSFLYITDKELIGKWIEYASIIARQLSVKDSIYGEMMSVEQRLLPVVAKLNNKPYSTLVSNVYLPGVKDVETDDFDPKPGMGGNVLDVGKWYFHLWGFKSELKYDITRNNIMANIIRDIKTDFPEYYDIFGKKFPKIQNYFV